MATPLHEPAAAEVGRTLREARLARGEPLAAAAEELRVRPAYLEALEEGRLGPRAVGVPSGRARRSPPDAAGPCRRQLREKHGPCVRTERPTVTRLSRGTPKFRDRTAGQPRRAPFLLRMSVA